jgi:signal transduction histidine kinase
MRSWRRFYGGRHPRRGLSIRRLPRRSGATGSPAPGGLPTLAAMTNAPAPSPTMSTLRASWRYWLESESTPPAGSAWLQLLWTALFACAVALAFTLVGFAATARTLSDWLSLGDWRLWYGRNLLVAGIISFTIQGLFKLAFAAFGRARFARAKGWRRTLFFSGVPLLGTAIGWPIGMSLIYGRLRLFTEITSGQVVSLVVISLMVSALISQFFSLRHKEMQAQMRANEAQLRLLQGQMEPHFLFNTLANVISLIDADAPRAKHMLEALTDYLRASLRGLRHDDSTLAGELDLARRYLQLMQSRMGDRLRFELVADDTLSRAALMPLVLQPLIENAVKHGLEPQVDGGTVRVTAARVAVDGQDSLQVCVEDDGPGLEVAARRPRRTVAGGPDGNGVALANLRERLQARFGDAARLTLAGLESGSGTRACIVVPWRVASAA